MIRKLAIASIVLTATTCIAQQFGQYQHAHRVSRTGLVGEWLFFDGQDFSGSANHINAVSNGGVIANGVCDLSLTNAFCSIPDADSLTPSNCLSISAWVYLDRDAAQDELPCIAAKEGGSTIRSWYLSLQTIGSPHFCTNAPFLVVSDDGSTFENWIATYCTVPANGWHHVVAIYAGSDDFQFYLDGIQQTDEEYTGSTDAQFVYNNTAAMEIGSRRVNTTSKLQGDVTKLRIYSVVLTSNDVTRLYLEGHP